MSSSNSDSFLIVFMNYSIRLSRILLRIKKFSEEGENKQTHIFLWFVLIDFSHYSPAHRTESTISCGFYGRKKYRFSPRCPRSQLYRTFLHIMNHPYTGRLNFTCHHRTRPYSVILNKCVDAEDFLIDNHLGPNSESITTKSVENVTSCESIHGDESEMGRITD
jgi:hypothetical protein